MSVVDIQRAPKSGEYEGDKIINDFSFVIATVNGTGSQTSNNTLLRALFKMGIAVTGKNLFPSNIAGLPTWYYVRVNKDGYRGHRPVAEVLIAYNLATFAEDVEDVPSGGVVVYPSDWNVSPSRDDLYYYTIPVKDLMKEFDVPSGLKDYVSNMVYLGAMAYLFNIDMDEIHSALEFHFNGKPKPVELNFDVAKRAYDWSEENLTKMDPYLVERIEGSAINENMIIVDGNSASGLGAVFGGVQFMAWYPITPSSSLAESADMYLNKYRKTEDGKATYAVVQAEDELAAIGMTIGAGWAGGRAMTATSGPGISLMAEFAGLAYYAEIPIVVWDIQRVGPSTGLPTRTSQGDVLFTHFLGHGDTRQILIFPSTPKECFEFGWRAFDIAEQMQQPVFVMSDLDLGMNLHTTQNFEYPDEPMNRGKVLSADELAQLADEWGRYKDLDGDGVAYRTLPGNMNPKSAWFARGTGHDEKAIYSEDADVWEHNMDRLARKIETAREILPQPILHAAENARFGIISYGSNEYAIVETLAKLAKQDITAEYLRVRALPASQAVYDFIDKHDYVYVVENNYDGQMAAILRMDMPEFATKIRIVARQNGLPLDADWIVSTIMEQEG